MTFFPLFFLNLILFVLVYSTIINFFFIWTILCTKCMICECFVFAFAPPNITHWSRHSWHFRSFIRSHTEKNLRAVADLIAFFHRQTAIQSLDLKNVLRKCIRMRKRFELPAKNHLMRWIWHFELRHKRNATDTNCCASNNAPVIFTPFDFTAFRNAWSNIPVYHLCQ